MSTDRGRNLVEQLTWDAVAQRIDAGAAAILPIGAGAKQHGFHLPMNTDRVQAEWLAGKIADRFDCLIWPTLSYGHYPAFVDYAGSVSLSAPAFESLIQEIAGGILSYGCRAVFVLDTGISTAAPVGRALARLGSAKALHLKAHDGPRYRRTAEQLCEQSHGSHADELETSIMLALAPHLVQMARAEASPPLTHDIPGPLTRSDPASPNFSRSGSFGDPTLATPAKGEMLLRKMIDDMIEQADRFLAALRGANTALRRTKRTGAS